MCRLNAVRIRVRVRIKVKKEGGFTDPLYHVDVVYCVELGCYSID